MQAAQNALYQNWTSPLTLRSICRAMALRTMQGQNRFAHEPTFSLPYDKRMVSIGVFCDQSDMALSLDDFHDRFLANAVQQMRSKLAGAFFIFDLELPEVQSCARYIYNGLSVRCSISDDSTGQKFIRFDVQYASWVGTVDAMR